MYHVRPYRSARADDNGVATTVEYALLAGVSVVIFLALGTAVSVFTSTAEADAIAIASFRVASSISSSSCDIVGSGDVSAVREIDLPEQICGMPYLAYPSPDGHSICVRVAEHRYNASMPLCMNDVKVSGFIASTPARHTIAYDAFSRTVTLS